MLKRLVEALESIAGSLKGIEGDIREMRDEQARYLALSQQEAEKSPQRILEIFDQVKTLAGGK